MNRKMFEALIWTENMSAEDGIGDRVDKTLFSLLDEMDYIIRTELSKQGAVAPCSPNWLTTPRTVFKAKIIDPGIRVSLR